MATKEEIKNEWAEKLVEMGKFDSEEELMEEDYCFACGMKSNTEKAHIKPKSRGGSDDAENLNLLCHICHLDSELIDDREEYIEWLEQAGFMSGVLNEIPEEDRISMGLKVFPEDYECPQCGERRMVFKERNDDTVVYCNNCDTTIDAKNIKG